MKGKKQRTIQTTWEVWTYDVWGNSRNGFEVNDRYNLHRNLELSIPVEISNAGTKFEFESAYPTNKHIRETFGVRCQIKTDGDDLNIYVNRSRDSYPIGEMFCTSHHSLSPIRPKLEFRINRKLAKYYRAARQRYWKTWMQYRGFIHSGSAVNAIREARIRLEWDEFECGEHNSPSVGNVRLRIEPDEFADIANLLGDTFNPKVNTDISPEKLKRQEKQEIERIERDGVWGMIGEYYDGEKWQQADSVWGFVGDDWKGSDYDLDVMASTLEQAKTIEICKCCGRPKHPKGSK